MFTRKCLFCSDFCIHSFIHAAFSSSLFHIYPEFYVSAGQQLLTSTFLGRFVRTTAVFLHVWLSVNLWELLRSLKITRWLTEYLINRVSERAHLSRTSQLEELWVNEKHMSDERVNFSRDSDVQTPVKKQSGNSRLVITSQDQWAEIGAHDGFQFLDFPSDSGCKSDYQCVDESRRRD